MRKDKKMNVISCYEVLRLKRLERTKQANQKIVLIRGIPTLVEKSKFALFLEKILRIGKTNG